jgi:hypothetical protein
MAHVSAALQLAMWVARKAKGTARLRWDGRELVLHFNNLQIVAVEGDDNDILASAFGLTSGGEWFRQAQGAVAGGQVSQAEANAVVKRALAEALRGFFLTPDGSVTLDEDAGFEGGALTVSYPHLAVEMVLGSDGEGLVGVFLSEPELVLRRQPEFLRRVGALGLTEEAMAILAKVNDSRTAMEIAVPSPHGKDTALRLLAAAIAAGLAEAAPRQPEPQFVPTAFDEAEPRKRRGVWGWIIAFLLIAAAGVALYMVQPWKPRRASGPGGPWAIAVDGGCQPAELERLYRRQDKDPESFSVVPYGQGQEPCYRLVWGHFPSRQEAEGAVPRLPQGVLTRGFAPHVVQVESDSP